MKILSLEVENIRGIKTIKIKPEGRSIVIFGPNGTGKSAIVDAVDFLMTGKISRLVGEGTGDLFLKEHGCHVDSRSDLKNTVVTAEIEIDDKKIRLKRSINKPNSLNVKPKEHKDLVESYLEIASLGQHILSRREILKYITAEAGKRAKEIMSLLDLMDIENIRSTLVSVKNEAETGFKYAETNFEVSKNEISILLSLPSFSEEAALNKVNELRVVLGGSEISELLPEKIKEKLKAHPFEATADSLTTDQVENTVKDVRSHLESKEEITSKVSELITLIEEVRKEEKFKQYSLFKKLFEAGITLVDETNVCPLCGRKWDEGDFKSFLEDKKKETDIAKEMQEKIDNTSILIKKKVVVFKNDLDTLVQAHNQFKLKTINQEELNSYMAMLDIWSGSMDNPLEIVENGKWPTTNLESIFSDSLLESQILAPLGETLKNVGELYSKRQIAWDTLTKMEDKWRKNQEAVQTKKVSELYKKRAVVSLDYFEKARDSVLENIYDSVKDNFDEYYKTIHSEDEDKFKSKISHVEAALNFEVDFYGRGMFPPHALHSEGHQDSMGLCLFFALNKYLTGDAIKVVVLDDVVMSIDRTHRRAICELLKKFFPDKQLIMTTHETAWAKQLRTEGIVNTKDMYHFVNWNIDTGPVFEMEKDLWVRIKEDLDKNDVPSAAHKLRRNAEYYFENICDLLETQITYRGHHRWDLGDYAPSAISAYKKHLKRAMKNFIKMGDKSKADELEVLNKKANDIINKSQIEQWAINESIHYNKWSDLDKAEFQPVIDAFKELFSLFECTCGSTISLVEKGGKDPKKVVTCSCGKIFWNVQS